MPLRYLICLAALASLALAVALSVGTRPTHAAELPTAISQSTSSQTAGSQTTDPQTAESQTTPEHLRASAWWPTKSLPNLDAYAGTAACATCHADIVASQATSQMARTLTPASQSTVLNQHLRKLYHSGPYTYSLAKSPGKKGADISVSVSDGAQQQSAILQWALGSGDVGQSYLWQKDGAFYESRFNFFSTLDTFDSTPGRLHGTPISIDMAIGRPLEPFEARSCLSCHTTAMSSASPLDFKSIIPGVSCEVCHGPGRDHIAAAKSHLATPSAPWNKQIVNSARMSPTESVDFCGACHSTPWDVRIMGAVGLQTVRFPAYRLEKSRCWGSAGDARLAADDLAGTIANLTRAIALDPQGAPAHLALGDAFWELNEYGPNSDSLREFTKAQQGDPAGYLSNFNLGSVLSQLGRYREAAPFLAKAGAADPASPDPWLQLGMNAYVGNHPAEALSALEKCVALTGADQARNSYQIRRVYAVLSRLHAEAGSDAEARRMSIRAEEVHAQMLRSDVSSTLSENTSSVTNNSPPRPKPPSALPGLATAPAPPSPPAQPQNLQLELQLQALVANSLNDAGTALARNHDYAAALPLFREASVADPTLAAATRNLGLAAFHTGNYDEAITALTRALEQNPADTLARTDLDQSLAALRNTHPPPSASPQKP